MKSLHYPFRLARADILRRVGRNRVSDTTHGNHADGLDTHGGGKSRQSFGSETVYHRLYQHHADGYRGLLKNRRQSDLRHILQLPAVKSFRLSAGELLQFPDKDKERHYRRDPLRDHSGPRHSGNAQIKLYYQHQIQRHIEHRRKNQEIKRNPGLPQSIEHGGKHVVHKQERQTVEIDIQILYRHPHNVLRRIQSRHDLPAEQKPKPAQQDAHCQKS